MEADFPPPPSSAQGPTQVTAKAHAQLKEAAREEESGREGEGESSALSVQGRTPRPAIAHFFVNVFRN